MTDLTEYGHDEAMDDGEIIGDLLVQPEFDDEHATEAYEANARRSKYIARLEASPTPVSEGVREALEVLSTAVFEAWYENDRTEGRRQADAIQAEGTAALATIEHALTTTDTAYSRLRDAAGDAFPYTKRPLTTQILGDRLYVGSTHHDGTTSMYDIWLSFEYGDAMTAESNATTMARAKLICELVNSTLRSLLTESEVR